MASLPLHGTLNGSSVVGALFVRPSVRSPPTDQNRRRTERQEREPRCAAVLCVHPPALQFEERGTTRTHTHTHVPTWRRDGGGEGKCHQYYFPLSDAVQEDDGQFPGECVYSRRHLTLVACGKVALYVFEFEPHTW